MEDKIKEAVEKAGSPSKVGEQGWSASTFGRGLSSFSLNRFLLLGQGLVDPRHPMSDFGRLDG